LLSAYAVTTRDTTLAMIPTSIFHRWLDTPIFRDEILGLFATRLTDLTSLIDTIVFHKLDSRLAGALLGHGTQILMTHQALADELGTVREMVTRLLRRFEQEGWVRLSRESIQILDQSALAIQAAG
jgi:CRP/FNR family transcriptional regulator